MRKELTVTSDTFEQAQLSPRFLELNISEVYPEVTHLKNIDNGEIYEIKKVQNEV